MTRTRVLFLCFSIVISISLSSIVQAKKRIWTVGYGTEYDFNEGDYSSYPAAIQAAVDSASAGDKVMVGEGNYYGAMVDKAVEIVGSGDDTVIISGPAHPYPPLSMYKVGFIVMDATEATVRDLQIYCNGSMVLGILIVRSDNTTVDHVSIQSPLEGINIIASSQCSITHNTIAGQLSSAYNAMNLLDGVPWGWIGPATGNTVAFNEIENGAGGGVALYALYGYPLTQNAIEKNKINNPSGIGLRLRSNAANYMNMYGNAFVFNDFRGCYDEIWYSQADLLTQNDFLANRGTQPPNEPYPVPTDKDQCKNDGWQYLFRADGTSFTNQGSCVSYVNTGN